MPVDEARVRVSGEQRLQLLHGAPVVAQDDLPAIVRPATGHVRQAFLRVVLVIGRRLDSPERHQLDAAQAHARAALQLPLHVRRAPVLVQHRKADEPVGMAPDGVGDDVVAVTLVARDRGETEHARPAFAQALHLPHDAVRIAVGDVIVAPAPAEVPVAVLELHVLRAFARAAELHVFVGGRRRGHPGMLRLAPGDQAPEVVARDPPLVGIVDLGARKRGHRHVGAEGRPVRAEQQALAAPSAGDVLDAAVEPVAAQLDVQVRAGVQRTVEGPLAAADAELADDDRQRGPAPAERHDGVVVGAVHRGGARPDLVRHEEDGHPGARQRLQQGVHGPLRQADAVLPGEQEQGAHMVRTHLPDELGRFRLLLGAGRHRRPGGMQPRVLHGGVQDTPVPVERMAGAAEAVDDERLADVVVVHLGQQVVARVQAGGSQAVMSSDRATGVEELPARHGRIVLPGSHGCRL